MRSSAPCGGPGGLPADRQVVGSSLPLVAAVLPRGVQPRHHNRRHSIRPDEQNKLTAPRSRKTGRVAPSNATTVLDGAERSTSPSRKTLRCMPLLGRNRSFLFNRGLNIVKVLQDGLFRHALEQKHWNRHQSCNDTLRFGVMRTNQRNAAATL